MARLGVDPRDPLDYTGIKSNIVPVVSAPREPTVNDNKYPLWTEWRVEENPSSGSVGDFWKLVAFSGGNALWVMVGSGAAGAVVTLSDTANTTVNPDVSGNIQLEGSAGLTVTSDAGNNKLTFALAGGGQAIDEIVPDSGTSPVVPTAGGAVSILGNSTQGMTTVGSLNTLTIAGIDSTAAATAGAAQKGVASFNNLHFSVASGFVSAVGLATFSWQTVSSTPISMMAYTGYIISFGSLVTLTLPATCSVGDVIRVVGDNAAGWKIAQNGGQTIHFGGSDTTTGAGGSLDSTGTYDCVELLCTTTDTDFTVISSLGTISVT